MNVLILGSDGYIGFTLTVDLLQKGYNVTGIDDLSRRRRVFEIGSDSLTPIAGPTGRNSYLRSTFSNFKNFYKITLGEEDPGYLRGILSETEPDAIIHLGEQPSAPYSMIDPYKAGETQRLNIIGTLDLLWAMREECPNAHLIKLGTMGEYGTPNCDIPEGTIPKECISGNRWPSTGEYYTPMMECKMAGLLFPRTAGSFYHLSKVHDTLNIHFACRNWGLRSTDVMQGVVFGLNNTENNNLITRFDYDEYFGTAINRFCAQAIIEHPLTVYGLGEQTRGFLPLKDSIQCLNIILENPPTTGEYRTFNQFENIYTINHLATTVCRCANNLGIKAGIQHIKNPRNECEKHYYNPDHRKLFDLGYEPTTDIEAEITELIKSILPYKDRITKKVIDPTTTWN